MNSVSGIKAYNQPIMFQSKISKTIPRKIRNKKLGNSALRSDASKDSRIKSLKTLIEKNPKISDIYNDLNSGKINLDDAAEKILNTIA